MGFGLAGHHDQDVSLARLDHALDDAKAGIGLSGSRGVGKENPVIPLKLLFGLQYVILLFGQQVGERCADVVDVAGFDGHGLGGALGVTLGRVVHTSRLHGLRFGARLSFGQIDDAVLNIGDKPDGIGLHAGDHGLVVTATHHGLNQ